MPRYALFLCLVSDDLAVAISLDLVMSDLLALVEVSFLEVLTLEEVLSSAKVCPEDSPSEFSMAGFLGDGLKPFVELEVDPPLLDP